MRIFCEQAQMNSWRRDTSALRTVLYNKATEERYKSISDHISDKEPASGIHDDFLQLNTEDRSQ